MFVCNDKSQNVSQNEIFNSLKNINLQATTERMETYMVHPDTVMMSTFYDGMI